MYYSELDTAQAVNVTCSRIQNTHEHILGIILFYSCKYVCPSIFKLLQFGDRQMLKAESLFCLVHLHDCVSTSCRVFIWEPSFTPLIPEHLRIVGQWSETSPCCSMQLELDCQVIPLRGFLAPPGWEPAPQGGSVGTIAVLMHQGCGLDPELGILSVQCFPHVCVGSVPCSSVSSHSPSVCLGYLLSRYLNNEQINICRIYMELSL